MRKKLAIISTHPIQYYAPVFQILAEQIELKVFYTWGESALKKFDKGFNRQVEWDLPLLEGYEYTFLNNTADDQGTHHFRGIINPTLITEVQDYKPDAILIYGWAWHSHLKAMRFFKGKIPVYFRGDSTLLNNQQGLKAFLKSLFLKCTYRNIDLAFYVGTANKSYFKKYGLREEQLVFSPHAIDNTRFAQIRNTEAEELRKELNIKKDDILILFAGKLELVKNPGLLLNAFINLDSNHVHLLFVGNGILERSLKLKVEGLVESVAKGSFGSYQADNSYDQGDNINAQDDEIKKRIHFMDFQNQSKMPAIYQACDLFCLPSVSETWGLAVNEAMAAGKTILVSTQVGCSTDLVKQGVNGEIFKSGDLNELVQKLKELTKNKENLIRMGLAAQRLIQDWSFEKQVKMIVDTLKNNHAK